MKKVLVAGATGVLGQEVVKQLKEAGYWVRALSRTKEAGEELVGLADNIFLGNPLDASSLTGLCLDIDIVFSCMGKSLSLFTESPHSFYEVDYLGNKNILLEALKSKVSRFVYVSVFNASQRMDLEFARAHELFAEELRFSTLSYSIINTVGLFTGFQDLLRVARMGFIPTIGDGEAKTNPIHPADLAEICIQNLEEGEKEIEVGGPQTFSRNEIAQMACVAANCRGNLHIPKTIAGLGMLFLPFFNHTHLYDKLAIFKQVMTQDEVAPSFGKRLLGDYFMETSTHLHALPENY